MNTAPTTLRGVFPERKIPPKKNFIKENVRRIRQMQEPTRQGSSESRLNQSPVVAKTSSTSRPVLNEDEINFKGRVSPGRKPGIQRLEIKPTRKNETVKAVVQDEKIIHRSMQTETSDNLETIYSTGVVKYPRQAVVQLLQKNRKCTSFRKGDFGHGDSLTTRDVYQQQRLDGTTDKTDHIKRNMNNIRNARTKDTVDPNKAPPSYKKGVVPNYIKQKKELENVGNGDIECPPGHVLLPDEERKETLKVLRESYAEKIQELNIMPVRSDTLKQQRRKMELEEELKKIDEGIKVFQRPKVFVKINV